MLLCFSNKGKLYWIKVYQIPQASRNSRGKPLVNLLRLDSGERVSAILPVKSFDEDRYVFMATSKGKVKKVSLMHFSRPRLNGIISINLADDDELVGVDITQSGETVMLFSDSGKAIRFDESEVRPVGRTAGGCIGMRLKKNNKVIALCVIRGDGSILTATENGYGKRSSIDEYRIIGRAGQGVISIQISERNGNVIGAVQVDDSSEIMLITQGGTLVRTRASEISVIGRNTQGVRLINLSGDEKLIGLDRVIDVENVEC
jgi:DNA gyrase subunit A